MSSFSQELARVSTYARAQNAPQFAKAKLIVDGIMSTPPKGKNPPEVYPYFKERVTDDIPKKYLTDDTFWSCFLYLLGDSGKENGVFHQLVIRVHDDFHPGDVE